MSRFNDIRFAMIQELIDAGELIRKGEDYFEDMGGHVLHESNLDPYIESYLKGLSPEEREAVIAHVSGESGKPQHRQATCNTCGKSPVVSSPKLAFFELRPDRDTDSYYCGCYGWD